MDKYEEMRYYYKNADKIEIQENYSEEQKKAIEKINREKEYISFLRERTNHPEIFVEWIAGKPYWSENRVADVYYNLLKNERLLSSLIDDYLFKYVL